jgi:alpha 1,2-mannosyltransferase
MRTSRTNLSCFDQATIPTLWDTTKEFIKEHPEYLPEDNLMEWVSNDGGETYNLCHWWSNFEIARVGFWQSEAYTAYVDALDRAGGFYYERWGDAPVHSIAAALFLKKDEVHFFQSVGYRHEPFQQ